MFHMVKKASLTILAVSQILLDKQTTIFLKQIAIIKIHTEFFVKIPKSYLKNGQIDLVLSLIFCCFLSDKELAKKVPKIGLTRITNNHKQRSSEKKRKKEKKRERNTTATATTTNQRCLLCPALDHGCGAGVLQEGKRE